MHRIPKPLDRQNPIIFELHLQNALLDSIEIGLVNLTGLTNTPCFGVSLYSMYKSYFELRFSGFEYFPRFFTWHYFGR